MLIQHLDQAPQPGREQHVVIGAPAEIGMRRRDQAGQMEDVRPGPDHALPFEVPIGVDVWAVRDQPLDDLRAVVLGSVVEDDQDKIFELLSKDRLQRFGQMRRAIVDRHAQNHAGVRGGRALDKRPDRREDVLRRRGVRHPASITKPTRPISIGARHAQNGRAGDGPKSPRLICRTFPAARSKSTPQTTAPYRGPRRDGEEPERRVDGLLAESRPVDYQVRLLAGGMSNLQSFRN